MIGKGRALFASAHNPKVGGSNPPPATKAPRIDPKQLDYRLSHPHRAHADVSSPGARVDAKKAVEL
jgi:hypothetical protein